jgi:UDP-N-acetyl-D-glucosamine dehydrogenase
MNTPTTGSRSLGSCSTLDALCSKITARTARASVIGLGYVGLPLATELGRAGFSVVGLDKDETKVDAIRAGRSYIPDVEARLFGELVGAGKLTASFDASVLAECDTVSICVPTPLRKTKDPDMSFILDATALLAAYLHPGMLIILESTTYPGTTEEVILPVLEKSGLEVGKDFFLCFSPERVDPANPKFHTRNIPKVIGGVTPECTRAGALFYSQVMDTVVSVTSTRVAEMVKLLENTFRMINIGLANEMALMCDRMGIDVWEVIDAAATKPFGFMPFYPGPGLGGHCIPVDPHYLSWKIKQAGYEPRFIELASHVNSQMPFFVADKVQSALNEHCKPVKGSRVHIVGVAYKRDVSDIRESPALEVIAALEQRGAALSYSDPFVPELKLHGLTMQSQDLLEAAAACDCCVIVTNHSNVDYAALVEAAPMVVDTRNALKSLRSDKIFRL